MTDTRRRLELDERRAGAGPHRHLRDAALERGGVQPRERRNRLVVIHAERAQRLLCVQDRDFTQELGGSLRTGELGRLVGDDAQELTQEELVAPTEQRIEKLARVRPGVLVRGQKRAVDAMHVLARMSDLEQAEGALERLLQLV